MQNKFNRKILFNNLDILRKCRHLSKGDFNKLLKISNAYRNDYDSIGAQLLKGIQDYYPGIDETWLLTVHDVNTELPVLTKKYGVDTAPGNSGLADVEGLYKTQRTKSSSPDSKLESLKKTAEVLETDSIFRKALDSNIHAFHEAVTLRKELNITKTQLSQCESKIDEQNKVIEQQHDDIEELKKQINSMNEILLTIQSA